MVVENDAHQRCILLVGGDASRNRLNSGRVRCEEREPLEAVVQDALYSLIARGTIRGIVERVGDVGRQGTDPVEVWRVRGDGTTEIVRPFKHRGHDVDGDVAVGFHIRDDGVVPGCSYEALSGYMRAK